jgi:hypothetical protein
MFAKAILVLRSIDGVGTGAMNPQVAGLVALQGDLILLPSTRDHPQHQAERAGCPEVAMGQAITIGCLGSLAIGTG